MKPHTLLATAVLGFAALTRLDATITITRQPTNQWVSLGAHVTNQVTLTSTAPPITYEWRGPSQRLTGETNRSSVTLELVLPSIQTNQSGGYYVVLSDTDSVPVQSDTATITVDPSFIKITEGPLVNNLEPTESSTWWDYDNDGFLDFVGHLTAHTGGAVLQAFYRNNGDGTFTQITTNAIALTQKNCLAGSVGDYDNDGDPDIYTVCNYRSAGETIDDLFRNDRNGRFTALVGDPWRRDLDKSFDCSFVDIDGDGLLDVFVLNYDQPSCLYHQMIAGTFEKLTAAQVGSILNNPGQSYSAAWVDYDHDGDLDLWTGNYQGSTRLHRNDGTGFFSLATPPSFAASPGGLGIWADFDNDGFPELFVGGDTASGPRPNALFRGMAGENFTNVGATAGVGVTMASWGSAVGDYDNDGWIDIFATYWYEGAADSSKANVLFHNRGDGTFDQVDVGSPIRDGSDWRMGARWVDYDNDGFLDLFMNCGSSELSRLNHLYRNNGPANGNPNHWLKVKLNGQASNRSGIGAKIRVKATIGGKEIWQMREMTGNGISQTCPGLVAHFGLGDSVQAATVRVEWPSGIVQTLTNVPAGQTGQAPLLVTEHQDYSGVPPAFADTSFSPTGFDLAIAEPAVGVVYVLEGSADLATWTKLMARTSTGGTYEWVDEQASNWPTRFYRLVVP